LEKVIVRVRRKNKMLKDILLQIRPLFGEEKNYMQSFADLLSVEDFKKVRKFKKQFKINFKFDNLGLTILNDKAFPKIESKDTAVKDFAEKTNEKIRSKVKKQLFEEFSKEIYDRMSETIAPHIHGLDMVKRALVLQLFAKEPFHILLLGDPGTGKTDLIRSAADLHPISSFGLGSGTTGVGLVVTIKGNEIIKGLLPNADEGVCAIDELNLMKEENRAGLYNAMEKGFVTYDKGGKHVRFDARVRVVATANPRGDRFNGKNVKELKRQLPFDSALLTRFHLLFLVRKPDLKKFADIAKSIVDEKKAKVKEKDIDFIKEYVKYALEKKATIPEKLKQQIIDFSKAIKKSEDKYLVEVSPRLILGFIRLAKASALMDLREEVNQTDVDRAKDIVTNSLRLG